jgi:putative endonuclease
MQHAQQHLKHYMYLLECSDGSYYTGSTIDLDLRLMQHQEGEGSNYTKKRLPVKLMYFEEYQRVYEVFYPEKQVQRWSRKKKEALMYGFSDELKKLAACMNESHYKNRPTGPFDSVQGPDGSDLSKVIWFTPP